MSQEITFDFAGLNSLDDLNLIVNNIQRKILPDPSENSEDVPAKLGDIYQGTSYGAKEFEVDVTIMAYSEQDRVDQMHQLSKLFRHTGSGEFSLVFSDDPAYTYYAHVAEAGDVERVSDKSPWGEFTIKFVCSDPLGYGKHYTEPLDADNDSIQVEGNEQAYPIFTCIPKKDVREIGVIDHNGDYVFIGSNVDPDTGKSPIDNEPLVMKDRSNDLSPWTILSEDNVTFNIENGVVDGKMGTTKNAIKADDFGDVIKAGYTWHGPAIQRYLPASYEDYHIRARLINTQSYTRAKGKVEVYLLDSEGFRVGKIMIKDIGDNKKAYTHVQLGAKSDPEGGNSKAVYYGYGDIDHRPDNKFHIQIQDGTKEIEEDNKKKTVPTWKTVTREEDNTESQFTNFYGYIDLRKVGNKYSVEIMKLSDNQQPAWNKPITARWTDTEGKFSHSLAGVGIYLGKMDIEEDKNGKGNYPENNVKVADLRVWEIKNGGNKTGDEIPVIATEGDEIKIDSEDRTVYKDGDYFMKHLNAGSNFITLEGGQSHGFSFTPSFEDADWYIDYRPTTL